MDGLGWWSRASHESRVLVLAIGAALPGTVVALFVLWRGDFSSKVAWTVTVVLVTAWIGFTAALREEIVRPLQTLSNLLAALREGDFSIRGRDASTDDALGLAMVEANYLAEVLRRQRLGAVEAHALVRKVMAEIDVAAFAFDDRDRLSLINRRGERLVGRDAEEVLGLRASELGLEGCLAGDVPRVLEFGLAASPGRWEIRRGTFRQGGRPHRLVLLSDLTRTLREEERQAWQRLVRVLRHEINNSLAPIHSLAGSLRSLLRRDPPPGDWREDLVHGLDVIANRSRALGRFMSAYTRLTRLPEPDVALVDVPAWVERVVGLETRLPVRVAGGPEIAVRADGDQLEQLLINLVTNAVDAVIDSDGGVEVGWCRVDNGTSLLELWVDDDGPGLPDSPHLFVPFFTTKPLGSGIGLVLSRQIAEAHRGTLTLENRTGVSHGCRARLRLPIE